MFGLTGLVNILVSMLVYILEFCIILGIIWLILPYAFKWVVAKHFDGSYEPKKDTLTAPNDLPPQNNTPAITIDTENKSYEITFGKDRKFTQGRIKILVNGIWYAANPIENEQKLLFKGEEKTSEATNLGEANKTTWNWEIPDTQSQFSTVFYIYEKKNYLLFEFSSTTGIPNTSIADPEIANCVFPAFENKSHNKRIFGYKNTIFTPGMRDFKFATAPICLFDDDKNCVLISAFNHYITNGIQKINTIVNEKIVPNEFSLALGTSGEISKIPENHSHTYIMVFDKGINNTFQVWGNLLRQFHKVEKKSRYPDIMVSHLGFFTDNGAHYYYNPIKGTKFDETLIAVNDYAEKENIPFAYYHLDSWWYLKSVQQWKRTLLGGLGRIVGGGLYGGTILWEIDPFALDMDFDELYEKLHNKPLTAHNRWYGVDTPYIKDFNFIVEGNKSMPDDPKFWEHLMSYSKKNHIEVYEQDWMKNQIAAFSYLRTDIGAGHRWLKNMADAAQNNGITIQYCMATPSMWMESVSFPAVTNARASGDYMPRWPHVYDVPFLLQASMLAQALGLAPFKDVFQSTRKGRINGERCPVLQALVSALSTGPVAPGDEIGWVNKAICDAVARKDGLLYKPDRPLTAADITYIKNSKYYLATTETTNNDNIWHYVLTTHFWPHRVKDKSYTLKDIDIAGKYIEYDWFTQASRLVDENTQISQKLKIEEHKYRIYAPILSNGMAVLGDPTKYVMVSDVEFPTIKMNGKCLEILVENVEEAVSEILIYTEKAPKEIFVDKNEIPLSDGNSSVQDCLQINYSNTEKLMHIILKFEKGKKSALIRI
jgi:hypothetical protein